MFRFFNLNEWSKLEKSLEQKPNILLSQFSVIAIIASLIEAVNDMIYYNYIAVFLDLALVIIFIFTFQLNEKKKHLLAKFLFIVLGNGFIFFSAGVISKSVGLYLIFFPMIAIGFLIFNNEERRLKYYSVIYVVMLLLILEIFNYQPFGDINWTFNKSEVSSFYVNMFVSVSAIVFAMYNFDVINSKIDQVRVDALSQLEQKNTELEKTNEELDHFVYSASHDLKAPLSSILGLVNIAKYEIEDKNAMDYFVRIEDRVSRLTSFIKDVIEISKNTRTEIQSESVQIEALIDDIIENNSYIEGMENIDFRKEINFSV